MLTHGLAILSPTQACETWPATEKHLGKQIVILSPEIWLLLTTDSSASFLGTSIGEEQDLWDSSSSKSPVSQKETYQFKLNSSYGFILYKGHSSLFINFPSKPVELVSAASARTPAGTVGFSPTLCPQHACCSSPKSTLGGQGNLQNSVGSKERGNHFASKQKYLHWQNYLFSEALNSTLCVATFHVVRWSSSIEYMTVLILGHLNLTPIKLEHNSLIETVIPQTFACGL